MRGRQLQPRKMQGQRKLSERSYAQARRDALQAKASALAALAAAEGQDNDPP
jgi:hypothetical protein